MADLGCELGDMSVQDWTAFAITPEHMLRGTPAPSTPVFIPSISLSCDVDMTSTPGTSLTDAGSEVTTGVPDTDSDNDDKKKRATRAVKWVFTWNNYPSDWKKHIERVRPLVFRLVAYAEVGEKGTPHIQGYLEFEPYQKRRPIEYLQLPKQIHWKSGCKKGTLQSNVNYCSKDKSTDHIKWNVPEPEKPVMYEEEEYRINITLHPWQKDVCRILDHDLVHTDDRTIYWFWEPYGGLGKTTFQKWLNQNYRGVMPLSGAAKDMKNGVCEYHATEKRFPKIILVNLPKTFDMTYFSATGCEEVKDMWFYSGKYHGGPVDGRPPIMMIFSNEEPPNLDVVSRDRWLIVRLPDGKARDTDQPRRWDWSKRKLEPQIFDSGPSVGDPTELEQLATWVRLKKWKRLVVTMMMRSK